LVYQIIGGYANEGRSLLPVVHCLLPT
jgi:hypothetical protein